MRDFSPSRPHVSKALYFDMVRQMPKQFIKGRKPASCSPVQDRPGLAMVFREDIGLQDLASDFNYSARIFLPGLP